MARQTLFLLSYSELPKHIADQHDRHWLLNEDPGSGALFWTSGSESVFLSPNWEGADGVVVQFDLEEGYPITFTVPWEFPVPALTSQEVYLGICVAVLSKFHVTPVVVKESGPYQAPGFEEEGTGGGCTALIKKLPGEPSMYIMLTVPGGGCSPSYQSEANNEGVVAGVYLENEGSDIIYEDYRNMPDCLASLDALVMKAKALILPEGGTK